jgi:hypothetical protein
MNKAQLWERKTDQIVSAELLPEMTPEQVVQTGELWQRFRVQARERLRRERASVPEHDHWNWDEKSHYLKFTAYRCLGIRYDDEVQGLMMISTLAVEGRLPIHKGKPVLYVKYIESAPWNLKAYMGAEARFGGIGISLIRAAIAASLEEEFRGRIALHSLPQSEPFYARFMEDLGIDLDVEKLRYFEMSEERAVKFMKGGDV